MGQAEKEGGWVSFSVSLWDQSQNLGDTSGKKLASHHLTQIMNRKRFEFQIKLLIFGHLKWLAEKRFINLVTAKAILYLTWNWIAHFFLPLCEKSHGKALNPVLNPHGPLLYLPFSCQPGFSFSVFFAFKTSVKCIWGCFLRSVSLLVSHQQLNKDSQFGL